MESIPAPKSLRFSSSVCVLLEHAKRALVYDLRQVQSSHLDAVSLAVVCSSPSLSSLAEVGSGRVMTCRIQSCQSPTTVINDLF